MVKNFFSILINSVIQPKFYRELRKKSFGQGLAYFGGLNLLIGLLVVIRIMIPLTSFDLQRVINQSFMIFPPELVISGDREGIKINQPLPYRIELPADWSRTLKKNVSFDGNLSPLSKTLTTDQPLTLMTFSTDDQVKGIKDFYEAKTLILLTPTTAYYYDNADGEVKIAPMPVYETSWQVSSAEMQGAKEKLLNWWLIKDRWYLPIVGGGLLLILWPLLTIWKMWGLVFYAFSAWITVKLFWKNQKIAYGEIYRLSFYGVTLITIIKLIWELLPNWPWQLQGGWHWLAYLMWMGFLISQLPEPKTPARTQN